MRRSRSPTTGGSPFFQTVEQAQGTICRFVTSNTVIRCAAGFAGVHFVATYGFPANPGQPAAGSGSTQDGVHPTAAYSHAVSDFLAADIISFFGL